MILFLKKKPDAQLTRKVGVRRLLGVGEFLKAVNVLILERI